MPKAHALRVLTASLLPIVFLWGGETFADGGSGPPAGSWSGLYLGAHAGWGGADVNDTYDVGTAGASQFSFDADGFVGGIYGGYNIQSGNMVVGIEGDVTFGNVEGTALCTTACSGTGTQPTFEIDTVGTVRGRIGYAFDSLLVYATAGVGFADVSASDPLQGGSDGTTHVGFVAGGGFEWAVANNLSLRTEYIYGNYGAEDYALVTTPDRFEFETHTVRAGLSWRIGH